MNIEKLKDLRKRNKISQEDMARALDITLRTYQSKENGKTKFYFDEAIKIADKLEVKLEELI